MESTFLGRLALAAAFCVGAVPASHAQQEAAPEAPAAAAQANADGPWEKAAQAMQPGPRKVALSNQATLNLPEGYGFVPPAQGKALMEAMGNSIGDTFLGLIVPIGEESEWMATIDFEDAGYIKDDDAQHWKADELLDELKQGTEAGNERRTRLGFSPLEVTHWIEPPAYESATQRLVWSVELREKSAPAGTDNTVNYNTYVLGREGYVSLDFITSESRIEAEKPIAKQLLGSIAFNEGRRYADFNASTDKVAEYGLAALIGGVAAKKLGLFALAGALFAKFFKLIAVGVVAVGAAVRKFFFGRKTSP